MQVFSQISPNWLRLLRQAPYSVNWERGLVCPFKSKKAKNFLPAAGTYIIVNWERGLGRPFRAKKAKKSLPAVGTYITIVSWGRG